MRETRSEHRRFESSVLLARLVSWVVSVPAMSKAYIYAS